MDIIPYLIVVLFLLILSLVFGFGLLYVIAVLINNYRFEKSKSDKYHQFNMNNKNTRKWT